MNNRETIIGQFLQKAGLDKARRYPLPSDASTRRYERLHLNDGTSLMLMDQPPSMESEPCTSSMSQDERITKGWNATARLAAGRIEAFVANANYLNAQGLSAPKVFECDELNGLLISEDLGDGLFARLIEGGEPPKPLYFAAIEAQAKLHEVAPPEMLNESWPLLSYDRLALSAGVNLFIDWYPKFSAHKVPDDQAIADWHELWAPICEAAEAEACVFVHRDYHAENLIWLPKRQGIARVGLIDFQDSLKAHPSWDLHSLLQDARRDVSPELEAQCLDHYFSLRPHIDRVDFMKHYNGLAALNVVRILGIFARLVYRDNKPRYAGFMPRMWAYLARDLRSAQLSNLRQWFIINGYANELT